MPALPLNDVQVSMEASRVVMTGVPPTVPSFADVFRTHSNFVWRVLRRLGVRRADAEDVAQEVFLVVYRKLPEFEGRSSLRSWIYGICIRTASDYRRRAHVRREITTGETRDEPVGAGLDESLDARRARDVLDAALGTLDDDKRAVFVLFEIEQLPMEEVAEAVGCPIKTAYSRLYAAREKLKATLRRRRVSGGAA